MGVPSRARPWLNLIDDDALENNPKLEERLIVHFGIVRCGRQSYLRFFEPLRSARSW